MADRLGGVSRTICAHGSTGSGRLFPIFYKFEPLQNEELKGRLVRLGERAGTRVRGVYKWNLSEKSKKANAALTGLGNTRRIILADTLLEKYSADEIEAVLAHELGHHVHKHILKSIAVQAGVTLVGFWAANWALHYAVERWHLFDSMSDFANLPLLVLLSTVLSFLLLPALNAFSRYNERQADRYAFQSIASVQPFISSMNKLAEQNLAERTPSTCVEWFFHSHPAISRRVAAAEAWAKPAKATRRLRPWQLRTHSDILGPPRTGEDARAYILRRFSTRSRSSSVSTPMVSNGVSATWMGIPFSRKRNCSSRSLRSSGDSDSAQNRSSAAFR